MGAVCDVIVSIACGVQIVGNQVTVTVKPVISSIADAIPCDGDISLVDYRANAGGWIDIGCFGIAIEYSTSVSVV